MRTRPVVIHRLLAVGVLPVALTTACATRQSHASIVAAAQRPIVVAGASAALAPAASVPAGSVQPSTPGGPAAASTLAAGPGASSAPAVVGPVGPAPATGAVASAGPAGIASGQPRTSNPATAKQDTTPVMLCQTGSFTGQAGPPLGNAQPALAAWVRWTNAHGGLAGHLVKLDSKDDAQDANKALQIAQNCVQNEHAVAFVASMMVVSAGTVGQYAQSQKVPVVGGDALEDVWFTNPYMFPEGASPEGIDGGAVAAWKAAGKTSPAIVYCVESSACPEANKDVQAQAKAQGIPVKQTYQVSLANPSFTSQCSSMKSANIDAVHVDLDGSGIQRLARDCNAIGFHPLYTTGSLALDANAVVSDPNLEGLTVATGVFPWITSATQASKDFQTAMSTYAPNTSPTESAADAWTSGQLLAEAIAKVGNAARTGPITSAMIMQGLGMIKNDTLGGLVMGPLTFTAGQPSPRLRCTGLATLHNGAWTAPKGATPTCV
ncbi:MAG TPA: ABC transporter substrate-binding protein [Mycobacteriales bacterium]|nr:ABC transporter substrate-binding protein [Mycobacteriales bacterium]